jgi:glycosyltransferase involved in cell wall biosynthesis
MRVVIDGRTIQDHFPGIGRYVYNLTDALAAGAADLEIVLIYDPTHPSSRFDLHALRHVHLAAAPMTPFSPRSQIAIPRLLREWQADLYHSTYYVMPYAAGCPTVVTLYDTIPFIYPEYLASRRARWLFQRATRLAAQRADQVITISQAAAGDLLRYLPLKPADITVTPLAAEGRFQPHENRDAIGRWKQAAGLPPRYVLYLGINKPHKNLVRLVRAWHSICQQWETGWGERPTLVLAGREDPRYPEVRDAVREMKLEDAVHFAGDVADIDLPWLYAGATLFVFPSLYEGFGLPVLEAMACGAPVACSNRSSLPEIVGEAAATFEPEDEPDMAATILELLRDPTRQAACRQAGLARAAGFSWERTAQLTLDAYRQALQPSTDTPTED